MLFSELWPHQHPWNPELLFPGVSTLQLKPTELVSGQARGNLLTHEFLLLQTTSTALPGLLRAHDRISHLHSQECSWRLDFHNCWAFSAAPISCSSRSCGCLAPPKEQFDEGGRQGTLPGSGRRLQMQSVSFKLLKWGAGVSKCSGNPLPKCGRGPWAGTGTGWGKQGWIPALALVPAGKEWAEQARSGLLDVSDHCLSLHQPHSTTGADVRAGPHQTPQEQQFES